MKNKFPLIISITAVALAAVFVISQIIQPQSKYPKHKIIQAKETVSDVDIPGIVKEVMPVVEKPVEKLGQKYLTEEEKQNYSKAIEKMKACEKDSDCARVSDGPCGCGGGGQDTSVNRSYVDEYKNLHHKMYPQIGCIAVMSNDLSCIAPALCVESKCNIDTENPAVCEKTDNSNRCYNEFALKLKDVSICDKIQVDRYYSRKDCLISLATKKSDVSVCDLLNGDDKIECTDDFYSRQAKNNKDYNLCLNIVNIKSREDCLFTIISNSDHEENCSRLASKDKQDLCVSNILYKRAQDKKDPEICKGIPIEKETDHSRNNCFNRVGPFSGKVEYCVHDESYGEWLYPSCVERIGLMLGQYKLCEGITDEQTRFRCYMDVLTGGKMKYEDSIRACKSMTDEKDRRRSCLEKVSIYFSNDTYCPETYDPDNCRQVISNKSKNTIIFDKSEESVFF